MSYRCRAFSGGIPNKEGERAIHDVRPPQLRRNGVGLVGFVGGVDLHNPLPVANPLLRLVGLQLERLVRFRVRAGGGLRLVRIGLPNVDATAVGGFVVKMS